MYTKEETEETFQYDNQASLWSYLELAQANEWLGYHGSAKQNKYMSIKKLNVKRCITTNKIKSHSENSHSSETNKLLDHR